jgi:hypothetical protein
LIHNAEICDQKPEEPEPDSDSSDDESETGGEDGARWSEYGEYRETLAKWEKRLEDEKDEVKAFTHHLPLGMGLLRSCRQLYHETIGILYFQNTFVISRVLTRHDNDDLGPDCNCWEYNQLAYAPVRLRSLGSQFGLLKKVVIDISTICDPSCEYANEDPDLLLFICIL